jgi:hypothetical protein
MGFNDLFIKKLKETGIGLIEFNPVNEEINFIIEAEKNDSRWFPNINSLKDIVNRIANKKIFAV